MKNFYYSLFLFTTYVSSIQYVNGQNTVVTPAPAPAIMCVTGGFTTLGTIYIVETANGNFSSGTNQTYIMSLPNNFQFNTAVTPTVTVNVGSGLSNIVVSPPTATTFTFSYDAAPSSASKIDSLIITNLQVKAITIGSIGDIVRSGGTASQAGNIVADGQNHCSLGSISNVAIATQPVNKTVCTGTSNVAIFDITATGTGLTYSWERDNNNAGDGAGFDAISPALAAFYSNATTPTLTDITPDIAQNGFLFRCIVSSTCGGPLTSNVGTLSVANPASTTDPSNQTICSGSNATFSVTGTNAVSYQWQENGSPISNGGVYSGALTNTLTLTGVTTAMGMSGRTYRCVVTGACGTPATSASRTLTVNAATVITSQPADKTACVNSSPTFSVAATGTSLAYAWERDRVDGSGFGTPPNGPPNGYSNINTNTITANTVSSSQNGYLFKCTVTGSCGTVVSNIAELTVFSSATLSYFGLDGSYCRNSPIDTLTGFPVGGVFSGPGVGTTNLLTGKAAFNPLAAGAGSKTINYTLGCSIPHSTTVNDSTTIAYTSPANANPSYFTTDPPVDLVVETVPPTGPIASGTFSGSGVSGTKFYPTLVSAGGPYPVLFSYTNPSGCISKVTKGITVTSPGRNIPLLQAGSPFCQNAPVVLLDETTVQGGSPSFSPGYYEFDGYSGTGISSLGGNSYQFNPINPGSYVINYNVRVLTLVYVYPSFIYEWRTSVYASQTVTVNTVTPVDFNLPASACKTGGVINLTPFPGVLAGAAGTAMSIFSPAGSPSGLLTGTNNTTFDPSAASSSSTIYTVRYTFYNGGGCPTILDKQINVFPKPDPPTLSTFYAPANQEVCRGNAANYWVTSLGGSATYNWYNNSALTVPVSTTYFYFPTASTANPGSTPYYVTQTIGGCTSDALNLTFTVRDNANVNAGIDQAKCMGPSYTLAGLSEKASTNASLGAIWIGGLGTFTPNRNTVNAVYTPATSEIPLPGTLAMKVILKLKSDYPDGPTGPCPADSDDVVLTINPNPIVNSVIVPATSLCKSVSAAPFQLNATYTSTIPGTGVYSDTTAGSPGVLGNYFNPSIAGIGAHKVYFKYTDINGCSSYHDTLLNVYGVPDVKFTVTNYCATSPTSFDTTGTRIPNDAISVIQSFRWNFGDSNTEGDTSLLPTTNYTYSKTLNAAAKQLYQVKLIVRTDKGCSNFKDSTIAIGNIPATDFNWSGICPANTTSYSDLSNFPLAEVAKYTWNFGNEATATGATAAFKNYSYKFIGGTGVYNVKFKIISKIGCADSITHMVNILDQYNPTPTDPYMKNFVTSNAFWAVDGQNPSWQWGVANKTNITTGARKAWTTNSVGPYYANEKSYLNGPCLDFSNLAKPMVALKIWSGTQTAIAGAILQYSINGGATWNLAGAKGSGVNWYDEVGVLGNPGNQQLFQYGWTGQYTGWKIAKIGLSNLKGLSSVRLRLAFGSGQDTLNLKDGFAIDSIWVGERDKLLLVENFTNSTSVAAAAADASLNDLVSNKRSSDVVAIHYHTGFPGTDQMNLRNQANPSSRVLNYGVPSVPYKIFEGNYNYGAGFDTSDIDRRSLDPAKFKIKLNSTVTASSVNVGATIIAKDTMKSDFVVHIAVVERHVTESSAQGTNGQTDFEWVLARMLPNAAGTYFNQDFNKNDSASIQQTWNFSSGEVYDAAQLQVVVFIQDIVTKEVYQTAYVPGTGSNASVVNSIFSSSNDLKIYVYPNPASSRSFVMFNKKVSEDYDWEIYDQLGKTVEHGTLKKDSEGFVLNTDSYPAGMYVVKIGNGKNLLYTKLLVVH